ncbi:hypothetical protein D8857_08905 [Streptococcus oralis]|uniref:Uncharacterized protein n=1 Tax=Streptococcus oralis TaxID=1303 RepID=A0A3R9I5Y4_STROR|nr:hypothetical protein D8857_08905 [Streptococcus oralis]
MSRAQATILTNICLIEDLETQRVVMQYRSPKTIAGLAMPFQEDMLRMARPLPSLSFVRFMKKQV